MAGASGLLAIANDSTTEAATLSRSIQLAERQDELLLQSQIVRLGAQSAYERMVHLFSEFFTRLQTAGLAGDDSFTTPLTHETIGAVLGLSVVHVNRTLQKLRIDRLVQLKGAVLTILDEKRMREIADWSPFSVPLGMLQRNEHAGK